ncbi:hypothetical protein DAEQUDRAFT_739400 [Daedalea quercina L-15889]|uniref:DUF6533 domain-containing protein n=1 Tax=Daedalea quercina L-15889 TaxID=1314783 RepID=A0A165NX34_9APHY|nr:hypothetical protein DAEQUDRAFT_739400 [Daedalea quercina L-15889]
MSASTGNAIEDVKIGIITNYALTTFAVFPLYDYILTIGSEGTFFWNRRVPLGIFALLLLARFTIVGITTTSMIFNWYAPPSLPMQVIPTEDHAVSDVVERAVVTLPMFCHRCSLNCPMHWKQIW